MLWSSFSSASFPTRHVPIWCRQARVDILVSLHLCTATGQYYQCLSAYWKSYFAFYNL